MPSARFRPYVCYKGDLVVPLYKTDRRHGIVTRSMTEDQFEDHIPRVEVYWDDDRRLVEHLSDIKVISQVLD
jgi:hypothetical protein